MCKIYKEVLRLVSEETEISTILIQSKSRLDDAVSARQMVAYFCFRAGISPRTIAYKLGISRQAVEKLTDNDRAHFVRKYFEIAK